MNLSNLLPALLVLAGLVAGCQSTSTQRQVERVAKDWCMVIRGSQVIPVYPLTEDVVPGDTYVVQMPREEEYRIYQSRGYLPLDHHVKRLRPTNYNEFYLGSYGIERGTNLPYGWMFPSQKGISNGVPGELSLSNSLFRMPHASFPSYSFSVSRSGGFKLALPIQGVPVALSMLGSQSAEGHVVLEDALTYGIDEQSMALQLVAWARTPEGRFVTDAYSPTATRTNYLRVINRVYLVGGANVSLFADSSHGEAGSAGADKKIDLNMATTNSLANFQQVRSNLNATVADAASPGGSFKFISVMSRSVTLNQKFPRPLVVGYIGFDLPILGPGRLGSWQATQARLEGQAATRPVAFGRDQNSDLIDAWLAGSTPRREQTRSWLESKGVRLPLAVTYFTSGSEYADLREEFVKQVVLANP